MLHRHDDNGLIVISQPAHAWISGQLASGWGNAAIGLEPAGAELRLAAEQHDLAWFDWEREPTLNRATGLPYTFSELPTREHLEVWSQARPRALNYGRLPALLISMHGTYLYERFHDYDSDSSEEASAAQAFLRDEKAFQERTISDLQERGDISHDRIEYQRRLLSLWDAMSLALCMGIQDGREFGNVPSGGEDLTLQMRRQAATLDSFIVEPWPFAGEEVKLVCEGRRLSGTFDDQAEMRSALADAPFERIEFSLRPGD